MTKKIICVAISLCIAVCAVSAAGISAGAVIDSLPIIDKIDEDAEALDYMLDSLNESGFGLDRSMPLIYLSLSEEAASQVKNSDKLTDYCVSAQKSNFSDKNTPEAVIEMIESLPDPSKDLDKFKSAAEDAGICYFALSEEQRSKVSNFEKLKNAAEKLSENPGFWSYGDTTLDGRVDTTDALFVLQNCVGIRVFNAKQKLLGDVDENGSITSFDALKILQAVTMPNVPLPTTD